MKSRLAVSFGEVADRKRKHPGEGTSGHLGASGKETSGVRGTRVPWRKVARTFLGRLTLGPDPIEAIGLGWLIRGIEPEPMVPTIIIAFAFITNLYIKKLFTTLLIN